MIISQLRGMYIEFLYNPCPYTNIASSIITTLHQSGTFFTTDGPTLIHYNPPKTNRANIRSCSSTPKYIYKESIIQKDICTPMFVAVLFTIIKTWKQTKIDKWIKMWYVCVCVYTPIYIVEYYSTIKKNVRMSFATTWIDLEIFRRSEISQRKSNISQILFICWI